VNMGKTIEKWRRKARGAKDAGADSAASMPASCKHEKLMFLTVSFAASRRKGDFLRAANLSACASSRRSSNFILGKAIEKWRRKAKGAKDAGIDTAGSMPASCKHSKLCLKSLLCCVMPGKGDFMFTQKTIRSTCLVFLTLLTAVSWGKTDSGPVVTAHLTPNDSLYATYQANIYKVMAIPDAWELATGDTSLTVAVLDSGVDFNHPDLAGRLLNNGYDFVNEDNDPSDDYGHGTIVAGIIAANTNNARGIAGASTCMILPVKVLNSQGKGNADDIAEGIRYAAASSADVINLSCGTPVYSREVEDAVNAAHDAGIVVIASTGNTGGAVEYPAACENAIAVGAVTASLEYADYSCFGRQVDLVAVGTGVASTTVNNGKSTYANATGTSFAAPFVSALTVLALSMDGSLTPDALKALMTENATDLGPAGWDEHTGYGCVNFARTLISLREKLNVADAD
jgi:hypothetical protein